MVRQKESKEGNRNSLSMKKKKAHPETVYKGPDLDHTPITHKTHKTHKAQAKNTNQPLESQRRAIKTIRQS